MAAHAEEYACRLVATHQADPGIGPGENETWAKSSAKHAVIACGKAASGQDCDLGHAGSGNRCDQLCAMFGNTLRLIFAANHETGNVLHKQQRYAALTGQFYEMRSLQIGRASCRERVCQYV